jgi:hypothetical protein
MAAQSFRLGNIKKNRKAIYSDLYYSWTTCTLNAWLSRINFSLQFKGVSVGARIWV